MVTLEEKKSRENNNITIKKTRQKTPGIEMQQIKAKYHFNLQKDGTCLS